MDQQVCSDQNQKLEFATNYISIAPLKQISLFQVPNMCQFQEELGGHTNHMKDYI